MSGYIMPTHRPHSNEHLLTSGKKVVLKNAAGLEVLRLILTLIVLKTIGRDFRRVERYDKK